MEEETRLIQTKIDFWPSLVDALTSALMIIILFTILQKVLSGDIEAAQVRAQQDILMAELHEKFEKANLLDAVSFERKPNLLQIRFSDRVLFDSEEYRLHQRGRAVLRLCAETLASRASIFGQIQVEGHTDDRPLPPKRSYPINNWELSTARAVEVLQELIKLNIQANTLSANGYAEQKPIAPNTTPRGRSLNRRIELRIVFSTPGTPSRN